MRSREIKQLLLVTGLLLLKIALLIAFFVWLTGCANTQYAEQIKRDMAKPKEDKTVIEKTTVSKEQREWAENNTYYKEVMVCTKFEKEVSKDGVEYGPDCRVETVQMIKSRPFIMPKEWIDMWSDEAVAKREEAKAEEEEQYQKRNKQLSNCDSWNMMDCL